MQAKKNKIAELQTIITKMPLGMCITVLPEFGVRWTEVSRAIRNFRLPMHSSSVARVLCQHSANSITESELDDILGQLRLKLVANQTRTWHVLHLLQPTLEVPVAELLRILPKRVLTALRNGKHRGKMVEVHSMTLDGLMYFSIQLVSESKPSSVLYVATPLGQPVALVSTVTAAKLLKACVEGLGYGAYQNADLHGKDIPSLLRIADPAWNANADHLTCMPPYEPTPTLLPNGIDYTNKSYDEQYVDSIIGPNPPLLTDLNIKSTKHFFDRSLLNKPINLTVSLKSDDIAKTLKCWVVKGAITPTSDFFQIFHRIKSNRINYNRDDSD